MLVKYNKFELHVIFLELCWLDGSPGFYFSLLMRSTYCNSQILPRSHSNNCSIFRRALFCRSCMKFQIASPLFPGVFPTFVAVVNTKFQKIGYFLLIIVLLQLGRDFKHNVKVGLSLSFKLLFRLVNSFLFFKLFFECYPYLLFNYYATSLTASNNNHSSSHKPTSFT